MPAKEIERLSTIIHYLWLILHINSNSIPQANILYLSPVQFGCFIVNLKLHGFNTAWLLPLLVGFIVWFLPSPTDVSQQAWHLLAIFLATIIGFVTKPLPIGAVATIALTVSVATSTLTIEQGLSGFSQKTAWLTVSSFLIARAIIKTGLGTRIAYLFITLFGRSSLWLSYGLLLTDLILSPVMPSGNARSGGVIFPIVKSLATAYSSEAYDGTERRIGAFLMFTAYQGTQITTALFLTAMVANPLMAQLAYEIAGVELDWMTWALAAFVPGMISLIAMPLIVYRFYPPDRKSTPQAFGIAQDKLRLMGNGTVGMGDGRSICFTAAVVGMGRTVEYRQRNYRFDWNCFAVAKWSINLGRYYSRT